MLHQIGQQRRFARGKLGFGITCAITACHDRDPHLLIQRDGPGTQEASQWRCNRLLPRHFDPADLIHCPPHQVEQVAPTQLRRTLLESIGDRCSDIMDAGRFEQIVNRTGLDSGDGCLQGGVPGEDNNDLARLLEVPLGEDDFFDEEDYMTFTPVDFSKKGVFLCGLSHGPKTIDESVAQAKAAAIRALSVLTKDRLVHQNVYADVNSGKCIACLTCVRVCPFGVPFINDDGVAEIIPVECRACGVCVSSCPNDAIELKSFTDFDVIPQIETMFA